MIPYSALEPTYNLFGIIPIQLWGVMVAIGFMALFFIARKEAVRKGLNPELYYDLFFNIFVGAVIGARIWFILFDWPNDEPLTLLGAISLWNGGMAFFGGFSGAIISGFIFTKLRKISFFDYADTVILGLPIGHFFGRIGCFLVEMHPGIQTTVPWALYHINGPYIGQLRHPVIIYEQMYLLIFFAILFVLRKKLNVSGQLCAVYGILYGTARFFNDFLREPSTDPRFYGFTATQYGLVVLVILSVSYLVYAYKKK